MHEPDLITGSEGPGKDPAVNDDAPVGIVVTVEDECLQGILIPSLGRGNVVYDCLEKIVHTFTGLCRNKASHVGIETEIMVDLLQA